MLCPIIAVGLTPHAIHCIASEYSKAKSAGCVMNV
jgi:hypothetical protein